MRSETALHKGMWSELIDRDLDLLIDGIQSFNDDLAPLESFVNSLGSLDDTAPSAEFLEHHAAEAAAAAQTRQPAIAGTGFTPRRRLALGLKRRVTASAASLMMILGLTGVAWASDSAVPGDWNYVIDLTLESIGIGAGGAEERIQELAAIAESGHPRGAELASQTGQDPTTAPNDHVVGTENAAATIADITRGSQRASDVREAVSALVAYLSDTEAAERPTISELGQKFKKAHGSSGSNRPEVNPGEQHRPEQTGKSEEPGKP
ncbi:MAG: hypothetical protein IH818_10890 [Acidobacteria bacterium]|nr:hypothetical protein [Acidobacteriota bacterium]